MKTRALAVLLLSACLAPSVSRGEPFRFCNGCIGIVGNADTMRRFRDDMNAELKRNGGRYALTVR